MSSNKRSSLPLVIRAHDKASKQNATDVYRGVLRLALHGLPQRETRVYVALLVHEGLWLELLEWAASVPAVHGTAEETYSVGQFVALVKKYPHAVPGIKQYARDKAQQKFDEAERRCQRYNLRFRRLRHRDCGPHSDTFYRARRWIRYVLGEEPDLAAIYARCDFGPGASIGVTGDATNSARKFLADRWTVTPQALPLALAAMSVAEPRIWEIFFPETMVCYDYDLLKERIMSRCDLVQHNKVSFVPKTTLVDRTIAVEPLLNGYVQKGIDLYMRSLLKRVGIDLTDQEVNRQMAFQGSNESWQENPYVTLDLSSASDSVSLELVRYLLPPAWFDLLNLVRAPAYRIKSNDTDHRYHKFVSMGNGFCFPLETLLFASICYGVSPNGDRDFTVYGDDIICRTEAAGAVTTALKYAGFRLNANKSFLSGPFRESCGADWYAGVNVRPLQLDYRLDSLRSMIKFHNMSLRQPHWSAYFHDVREYIWSVVPESVRLCRPFYGTVDTAFEVPQDRFLSSRFARWKKDLFTWSWLEWGTRPIPDRGCCERPGYSAVLAMAALRGTEADCPFAYRRKTKQLMRRVSHSEATASWLPPNLSR